MFLATARNIMNNKTSPAKTIVKRFRSMFGVNHEICPQVYNNISNFVEGLMPCHLLWALMLMKLYSSESALAAMTGTSEKTFRKWAWKVIESIAEMREEIVSTIKESKNNYLFSIAYLHLHLLLQYRLYGIIASHTIANNRDVHVLFLLMAPISVSWSNEMSHDRGTVTNSRARECAMKLGFQSLGVTLSTPRAPGGLVDTRTLLYSAED